MGKDLEHETPYGFSYARMDDYDIQEICKKCRMAYHGDFLPQDCEFCVLPTLVETLTLYAEQLDDLGSSGII